MIALDTSAVVAAFASWHEAHEEAAELLERTPRLPAHVVIETYSVLTRLPPPHRAAPSIVEDFLRESFPEAPLGLPAASQRSLIRLAVQKGFAGGAVYDLLVAATAKEAKATLYSRDRRALSAYRAVGVEFQLLS